MMRKLRDPKTWLLLLAAAWLLFAFYRNYNSTGAN